MIFQNSVGIGISSSRLSLIHLKTSLKGIRIAAEETHPLEKAKSLGDQSDEIVYLIREFIRTHTLGSADIFIGIPNEFTMIREVRFPMAARENLRDTLSYEMEKFIPISADQIAFDAHIMAEDKENNTIRVLLAVIRKSALAPYSELADRLEIPISGIEPCSSATANCFAYHIKPKNQEMIWDWLYRLHKGESVELPQDIDIPKPLIPAFGLAVKGLTQPAIGLNFLPADRRKKQGKTAYYTMFVLLALALLSGVGWGTSRAVRYKLIRNELNMQIQKFMKEVGEVDRIRAEAESIEKKIVYLNQLQNSRPSVLDMLAEMSKKIPDTVWIQQFTLSDKGLQIEGIADSASELVPILEASPVFKDVGFLSGITKEREGKERFLMGLKPE